MADYKDRDQDDWEPGDYEDHYDLGDYEDRDSEDDDPYDYEDRDPDCQDYYENRKPSDGLGFFAVFAFAVLVLTVWFVWWILRGTFFLISRLMDSKPVLRGLLQKIPALHGLLQEIQKSLAGK